MQENIYNVEKNQHNYAQESKLKSFETGNDVNFIYRHLLPK